MERPFKDSLRFRRRPPQPRRDYRRSGEAYQLHPEEKRQWRIHSQISHVGEIHHSSPLQTLEKKDVLEHLLDHRAVVRVSGLKLRLITIIMISNPFNHNITTS